MKRYLIAALAWTALAGFVTSDARARGGHGGGHHGGGHHGGHHGHHSHHGHHDHHHTHTHHHVGHHAGNHAFGHGWNGYGRGAWGWGAGGYAWGNPWGAASWATTAAWLGLPAVEADNVAVVESGSNELATPHTPAVVADTNLDKGDDGDNGAGDDSDDTVADNNGPIEQPAGATALAASGVADPAAQAKFLPLGVYTIAPEGETEAVAILHLAVSKEGIVRGTYHDLTTDKDETIRGAVDKNEHSIAWTIGANGKTIFHTWLEDLTEQSGPVTEKTAQGQTRVLTIARYTEEDAKQDGIGAPAESPTK